LLLCIEQGWRAVAADVSAFVGKGPVRLVLRAQFALTPLEAVSSFVFFTAADACKKNYLHIDDVYGRCFCFVRCCV
jgi:hypothetical protein